MRSASARAGRTISFILAAGAIALPALSMAGGCGGGQEEDPGVACRQTPVTEACTCDFVADRVDMTLSSCPIYGGEDTFCCQRDDSNGASPGATDVCGCGKVSCFYRDAGCYCQRFEYGDQYPDDVASSTPCTASTIEQKCCASSTSCSCDGRTSCPAGETEIDSCDPSALTACDAGQHAVAKCDDFESSSTSPNGSSGSGTTITSWAVGSWLAPPYDDDSSGKHIPVKGLGLYADGTYQHNSGGSIDDSGDWSDSAGVVTVGSHGNLDPARNCGFMNYNDGNRIDTYYRDDAPVGCPEPIAPLTSEERCLVGTFEETIDENVSIEHFTWTRTDFRNMIFDQIYTGNGDATITAIYYWEVKNSQLCTEGVDHVSGCTDIDWAKIEADRTSAIDPGCVMP